MLQKREITNFPEAITTEDGKRTHKSPADDYESEVPTIPKIFINESQLLRQRTTMQST